MINIADAKEGLIRAIMVNERLSRKDAEAKESIQFQAAFTKFHKTANTP